ncbi:MAG TPA: methionine--tRNA ligase [Candidatus Hydrothermia bacterium]|nr:methionine--tRNA ligase [Candidatus Hydrothermia bacterium]MDD5572472.1 methionine--tRNA ligase [Candidatus Hydrothermia bacterium]HOP32858.1 methionine--tRNA ligase [Candidatus Hydrothermia bacterium]
MKKYLITSALPYANGPLHIGHIAGAYLPADIYTRYRKLKGDYVIHVCGTDEHGVAITIKADREGKSPREIVDFYHKNVKESFDGLNICFDNFSRTSLPLHHKVSQEFFLRIYEKGYIYRKEIEQLYCANCNRFLPDRYVEGTCPFCGYDRARGDQCEQCGRWLEPKELINPFCTICGHRPIVKTSFHYYFKLKDFEKPLYDWLSSKAYWKENVLNQALSWVRDGLEDRAITRDLPWGVPVPLEEAAGKVLYVWFDAPIGYISSTIEWANKVGKPDEWKNFWLDPDTKIIHFIGKDNIVFHTLIWPAMLMAHGEYTLPDNVPANEFLNLMGSKLSTSRNWAIWIPDLLSKYPSDYIRYGLSHVIPETKDSDFSFEEFKTRINSELVNNLGNFVNRTLTFIKNYIGLVRHNLVGFRDQDLEIISEIENFPQQVGNHLENFEFRKALKEIMAFSQKGNQYFDYEKPWSTRKVDKEKTERTLYLCASMVKALSIIIEPYLPDSARRIRNMLGFSDQELKWEDAGKWTFDRDMELSKIEVLYKKLDESSNERVMILDENKREERAMDYVSYEEFMKMDIRIGEIVAVEEIPGTDKLYKLEVDLGDHIATLVAGIKSAYSKEELLHRKVPVLVNLEPRVLRGVTSNGMILACDVNGKPVLLSPDSNVPPGSKVK